MNRSVRVPVCERESESVHACVFWCVCARTCALSLRVRVCMCLCGYACLCTSVCVLAHVRAYACVCVCVLMRAPHRSDARQLSRRKRSFAGRSLTVMQMTATTQSSGPAPEFTTPTYTSMHTNMRCSLRRQSQQ